LFETLNRFAAHLSAASTEATMNAIWKRKWFQPQDPHTEKWLLSTNARRALVCFLLITIVGMMIDFASHINGWTAKSEVPWNKFHLVFYAGLVLMGYTLLVPYAWNMGKYRQTKGKNVPWSEGVPLPQNGFLALTGVLITFLGVVGDFMGHYIWGFELGASSLYSGSHLVMGIGFIVMISSSFIDYLQTNQSGLITWREWAIIVSVLVGTIVIGFVFHHSNPAEGTSQDQSANIDLYELTDSQDRVLTIEVGPMMDQFKDRSIMPGAAAYAWTGAWVGILLLVLATHFQYPSFVTILFFICQALPGFFTGRIEMVLAAAVAGGFMVVLLKMFPVFRLEKPKNLYVCTVGVPLSLYLCYTVAIWLKGQLWWTLYVVLGVPIFLVISGGVIGFCLLSLVTLNAKPRSLT
jgi:hypothetical protein